MHILRAWESTDFTLNFGNGNPLFCVGNCGDWRRRAAIPGATSRELFSQQEMDLKLLKILEIQGFGF